MSAKLERVLLDRKAMIEYQIQEQRVQIRLATERIAMLEEELWKGNGVALDALNEWKREEGKPCQGDDQ